MKDMERQKFENDFKNAFEQAGITPSDNLWTGIELDLEKAESKKMRRMLLMYKLMAAASISFAMFVAGAYYYAGFTNSNRDLAGSLVTNNGNIELPQTTVTQPQVSSTNKSASLDPRDKTSANNNIVNEDINRNAVDDTNNNDDRKFENGNKEQYVAKSALASSNPDGVTSGNDKENYSTIDNKNKKVEKSNEERIAESTLASNNLDGVNSGNDKESYSASDNKNKRIEKNNEERIAESTLASNNLDGVNSGNDKESYSAFDNKNIKVGKNNEDRIAKSALTSNNLGGANPNNNKENYSTHPSEKLTGNETGVVKADASKTQNSNNVSSVLDQRNNNKDELADASVDNKKIPPIVLLKKVELELPSAPQPDPFAVMMAKLQLREKELMEEGEEPKKKKKANRSETLWTSVGFAAGSFNSSSHTSSNGSAVTPAQSLMSSGFSKTTSSRVANNESSASGASYSMGLNLGTKITDRWIMQGGVNYLMQNSSYETDVVVTSSDLSGFRAASIAEFKTANSGASSDKVVSTAMYNVNNNSQFVSIPVQAGYLAVNRKVGLQINAGVSTDLFLKNIKDPQGVTIETTTQGRGSDSPYRPLNFSGLFGTELSYKLGQHYRLAINPGLRYPFNSIYKSGVGVTSNPLTMDIGMRFRYIFK